jgi:crotonobetainyl-CoA:carnitine CoA-transferase CaiB-like acyl-CoA transferase
VTKVEPPDSLGGDPMRTYAASYYATLHEGVEVRTLNLKDKDQRNEMDSLLANADVLITAQRQAALSKLQLASADLAARFPALCHIAIVGDEKSNVAGHDLTYLAAAGLARPPYLPTTLFADLAGAERAVAETFAALRVAEKTGRGHHCVVSMSATAHALAGPMKHGLTNTGGLLAGSHPGYNFYRAYDGWVALAALEPHFVERLTKLAGVEFTKKALKEFFDTKSVGEWKAWAIANDIPLSVIADFSLRQATNSPTPE